MEIANELLLHGAPERIAIATELKRARGFFTKNKTARHIAGNGVKLFGQLIVQRRSSFRVISKAGVTMGDKFFAYLCCSDHGWKDQQAEGHSANLVNAIGSYITEYYE